MIVFYRELFEGRLGIIESKDLRLVKVRYTGKEGVTTQGCPIAKWVGTTVVKWNLGGQKSYLQITGSVLL